MDVLDPWSDGHFTVPTYIVCDWNVRQHSHCFGTEYVRTNVRSYLDLRMYIRVSMSMNVNLRYKHVLVLERQGSVIMSTYICIYEFYECCTAM